MCKNYTYCYKKPVTRHEHQTLPPSPNQVPPRGCHHRPAHLSACWLATLLAGLAADGYLVCADVHSGTRHDGQEPRIVAKTIERQGAREGTKDRRGIERPALCRRLCRRGAQLALPVVLAAQLGRMGSRGSFFGVLPSLCRSATRKHLSLADH